MLKLRFEVDHAPATYQPVVIFPNGSQVTFGKSCTDRHEAGLIVSWLNDRGAGDELAEAVLAYVEAKVSSKGN
jgi:hypothetical protein